VYSSRLSRRLCSVSRPDFHVPGAVSGQGPFLAPFHHSAQHTRTHRQLSVCSMCPDVTLDCTAEPRSMPTPPMLLIIPLTQLLGWYCALVALTPPIIQYPSVPPQTLVECISSGMATCSSAPATAPHRVSINHQTTSSHARGGRLCDGCVSL
jgi:hypothetical protein